MRIIFIVLSLALVASFAFAQPAIFGLSPIKLPEAGLRFQLPVSENPQSSENEEPLPDGLKLRQYQDEQNSRGFFERIWSDIINDLRVFGEPQKKIFLASSPIDSELFTAQAMNAACVEQAVLKGTGMEGAAQQMIDAANSVGLNPRILFGVAAHETEFCTTGTTCADGSDRYNAFNVRVNGVWLSYNSWFEAALSASAVWTDARNGGRTTLTGVLCWYITGPNSGCTDIREYVGSALESQQAAINYYNGILRYWNKLVPCVVGGAVPVPIDGAPPAFVSPQIPPRKHKICLDKQCVEIDGPGIDRCSNTGDCVSRRTTCFNNQCIIINEPGVDECILADPDNPNNPNNDKLINFPGKCPMPTHRACVGSGLGARCAIVPGPGDDTCTTDIKCEEISEIPDNSDCKYECIDKDTCQNPPKGRSCERVGGNCNTPFLNGGVCCRCIEQVPCQNPPCTD